MPEIIIALDFSSRETALEWVAQLDPSACYLKVGASLFTRYGPALVETLMARGFSVFLDLKFHDVPHQVALACRSAAQLGVWMLSIHVMGGLAMCEAAAQVFTEMSADSTPYLVGVTVLTSMDQDHYTELGIERSIQTQVTHLAAMAVRAGLHGVVCSPLELSALRSSVPPEFLLVTPGIRPAHTAHDDQRRVLTPSEAIHRGADYLVIGRPITQAKDPMKMLSDIQRGIV